LCVCVCVCVCGPLTHSLFTLFLPVDCFQWSQSFVR